MSVIKKNKSLIFVLCYILYTSIYIARLNLSMTSPELKSTGVLNVTQIGILGSVFSIVYACGRLFNGIIGDTKPPYVMICTGLVLAGVSNVCISFFPPFIAIFILWGLNAYAQSMLWSSVLCIISAVYSKEVAKQKTAIMVSSVAMGNILGIVLNSFIISKMGVKFAFVIPGLLTIICGAVFFVAAKDIDNNASVSEKHISVFGLFKNKDIKIATVPAVLHGMMKDNISLFMTVFFVDRYHIDLNKSTYFVLFIPIIGFVGRTIYPLCFKLCREDENKVSAYAFLCCFISSLMICFGFVPAWLAAVCLSIIYACVSMINTSLLSIFPMRFAEEGNIASVSGMMDFATYCGAGIGSVFYGILIEHFGYTPMFASWVFVSVLSFMVLFKLLKNKKHNKDYAKKNQF